MGTVQSAAWNRPGAAGGRRCAWRPIDCAPWQAASARASLCISDPLRHAHAADGSGDALEQYSLFEVFDSETPANITERECAALIRIIEWKKQLIKMEIESIYFKGCRDNMEYLKTIGAL